jgi:hypothetical protein
MRAPWLVLLALIVTAAGANAGVLNGSFEERMPWSGTHTLHAGSTEIPGWTVRGRSVRWVSGPDPVTAEDGAAYVDVNQGGVEQVLETEPGTTYDVHFEMVGLAGLHLVVSAAGQSLDTGGGSVDGGLAWESRSFRFLATAGRTVLVFDSASPHPSPMLIDRVVVLPAQVTGVTGTTWGRLKRLYR